MTQIEGRRPVLEALRSGRRVLKVLLAREAKPAPVLREIEAAARKRGVPVEHVSRRDLDRRARGQATQGVIAIGAEFGYASLGDVLRVATRRGEPVLFVALDGVTDPHNVGAIARSAEAAGAHALILPARRAAPVTPVVEKAAAGALTWLPAVQVPNLPAALEELRRAGVWIVALDQGGAVDVWDLDLATEPLCLVVGSEGRGVARLVRERADQVATIPMGGRVASLNASVAAGVALFAIARRRRLASGGAQESS